MPGIKRDRSRVKEIDRVIREYYPENGADFVAEKIGEDRAYIMARAHLLKIRMTKKRTGKKKKPPSRVELQKRVKKLELLNKTLRLELIKLVDHKRKTS